MASVPEQAISDIVKHRIDKWCPHVHRCGCHSTLRLSAWNNLDALLRSGWTLTPPGGDPAP